MKRRYNFLVLKKNQITYYNFFKLKKYKGQTKNFTHFNFWELKKCSFLLVNTSFPSQRRINYFWKVPNWIVRGISHQYFQLLPFLLKESWSPDVMFMSSYFTCLMNFFFHLDSSFWAEKRLHDVWKNRIVFF